MSDQKFKLLEIADILDISEKQVQHILKEELDISKNG